MTAKTSIVLCLFAWWYLGCSSCSNNGGEDTGTGTPSSDSDGDTDTDADSDSDSDSDSDTEPDTETATTEISDAGPWDWEDLQEGEDCGEGCEQLTFGEEVPMLEWDVWGDLLVYKDETRMVNVVDIQNKKHLVLPNVHPELPIGPGLGSLLFYPAIYQRSVVYTHSSSHAEPKFSEIIKADIDGEFQEILYHVEENSNEDLEPGKYLDFYGNRIVGTGGCGNFSYHELCYFPIPAQTEPHVLVGGNYGAYNSLWEDVLVFQSAANYPDDIKGYDFQKHEFIDIAAENVVQIEPRIQGSNVVYQDLRYGTSDSWGNWNHSAVFVYNLETVTTTQITNAEWIAAYPDVYGNIVVWADYRDSTNPNDKQSLSGVQIWGYNLSTKQEFKITNILDRPKTTPRIWGDKVFVLMYKTTPGEDAIYMFDLPEDASK